MITRHMTFAKASGRGRKMFSARRGLLPMTRFAKIEARQLPCWRGADSRLMPANVTASAITPTSRGLLRPRSSILRSARKLQRGRLSLITEGADCRAGFALL